MRTIHKYTAFREMLSGVVGVPMPIGAKVLTMQIQRDDFVFWAEVDDIHEKEVRRFFLATTGNPIPSVAMRYIATAQRGPLVFHLYEVL